MHETTRKLLDDVPLPSLSSIRVYVTRRRTSLCRQASYTRLFLRDGYLLMLYAFYIVSYAHGREENAGMSNNQQDSCNGDHATFCQRCTTIQNTSPLTFRLEP